MRPMVVSLFALAGLIIARHALAADPVKYGDWAAGAANDRSFLYAGTANDSGEVFGEFCFFNTKKCNWVVELNTRCKVGVKTAVLANTDTSAVPLIVTCIGQMQNQKYSNGFDDWKTLESNIADSAHLGFAIPLADNTFKVVRFSLNGRTTATQVMEAAFFGAVKSGGGKPSTDGTADETL